jgi:hypothetical protein
MNHISIQLIKLALTVHFIIHKLPNKYLSVWQLQLPISIFSLIKEISIVNFPNIINRIHIFVVELTLRLLGSVIIDSSLSVETIHVPTSFIGELSIWIIKAPFSVHFVIFPWALVIASVLEIEDALTVSFAIFQLTDIFCAYVVLDGSLFKLERMRLDRGWLFTHFFYGWVVSFLHWSSIGS